MAGSLVSIGVTTGVLNQPAPTPVRAPDLQPVSAVRGCQISYPFVANPAQLVDSSVPNDLLNRLLLRAARSNELWGFRMRAITRLALYSLFCLLLTTGTSHAYLDPGTGSILLQGLIAGIAGGIVVMKLYWTKVKSFFSFKKKKDDKATKELTL